MICNYPSSRMMNREDEGRDWNPDRGGDSRLSDLGVNLIDAHCHLQDEAFNEDRDEVVRRARQAGVTSIVTSSLGLVDASRM